MKYHPIDRNLFIKNRAKFTAQMKPKSVAIFNSNDIYPISADSTMPFAQHRDIFYLSGVDQEESILLLFPDAPYEHQREMLFLRETNEHIAVWEGEKLTKERAFEVSGIKTVYCQLVNEHLLSLGACTISRQEYLNSLQDMIKQPPIDWKKYQEGVFSSKRIALSAQLIE